MINLTNTYPSTIEEAVTELKVKLPRRSLDHVRDTTEDKLTMYHFGRGATIRNYLGLSDDTNKALLEDCGCDCDDDAFRFIIWALWKELQNPDRG